MNCFEIPQQNICGTLAGIVEQIASLICFHSCKGHYPLYIINYRTMKIILTILLICSLAFGLTDNQIDKV